MDGIQSEKRSFHTSPVCFCITAGAPLAHPHPFERDEPLAEKTSGTLQGAFLAQKRQQLASHEEERHRSFGRAWRYPAPSPPPRAGLLSLRVSSCLVGIIAVSRASLRPYYRSYPFFEIKVQSHSRGGGNPVLCSKMDPRSESGMTSLRGIVLLRDEDKTLPMESKNLSKNLNSTALPPAGEGRGEGEIGAVSAGSKRTERRGLAPRRRPPMGCRRDGCSQPCPPLHGPPL